MVEGSSLDVDQLCRICSTDLKGKGVGIFSPECMDNLVGEKIRRYLYFSVSIKDTLPKMVCTNCLKKLENIHRFAKMAAEMQEKFRVILSSKNDKPKIKVKSLDVIRGPARNAVEEKESKESGNVKAPTEPKNTEVKTNAAVENVKNVRQGNKTYERTIKPKRTRSQTKAAVKERKKRTEKSEERNNKVARNIKVEKNVKVEKEEESKEMMGLMNGNVESNEKGKLFAEDDNEADTSDSDRLVIQDEEKPNPSLLHCLLVKGKRQQMTLDMDHDYLVKTKEEVDIKEQPDPEDEDIAEEIAEDRLNQIIKDEIESEPEHGSEEDKNSDIEITEMEVKVDPSLYFSNASQSGNEIEQDSQDEQDVLTIDVSCTPSTTTSNSIIVPKTITVIQPEKISQEKNNNPAENNPFVMTRLQQRMNPVIASLKLGKPYKCTLCPRSFITDIGLQNHLWSHLPKARKSQTKDGVMIPKNIDLEESQVYSSNGVLHTAQPPDNPHLLKYVCPICGKKISTKGNLKVHLETHRPKGKYGCDICGRVFKTAANLFRHKDYHGGVQFPCPVCGRVYPTNSTLRAHSITHSDLRPHKCPLCSKTFKRNQDLKFHINQHTGARPYQCPYCPKAFASSGNCFSHRKRMHPFEVERDKERAAEIMG